MAGTSLFDKKIKERKYNNMESVYVVTFIGGSNTDELTIYAITRSKNKAEEYIKKIEDKVECPYMEKYELDKVKKLN